MKWDTEKVQLAIELLRIGADVYQELMATYRQRVLEKLEFTDEEKRQLLEWLLEE